MTAASESWAITVADVDGRVRVEIGGIVVAESTDVRVLHEGTYVPRYYFPRDDVRAELLEPTDATTRCPLKGDASYWTVVLDNGERHDDVVWCYERPIDTMTEIEGRLSFYNDRVTLFIDGRPVESPSG